MSLVLYHRIDDPGSAPPPEPRVDFQNVDADGAAAFAEHGGRHAPALWDGAHLHEGMVAVLAALETLPR